MSSRTPRVQCRARFVKGRKLVRNRRIYISWLENRKSISEWKEQLYQRLLSDTLNPMSGFGPPLRTDDAEAGEIKESWLSSLVQGKRAPAPKGGAITDVVGVCTVMYLNANMGQLQDQMRGELHRFFEARNASAAAETIRVWLAPLEAARWRLYRVCDITLADPDGKHADWLIRLKGDNERFTWPSEQEAKCSDEIFQIARTIIGEPDQEES